MQLYCCIDFYKKYYIIHQTTCQEGIQKFMNGLIRFENLALQPVSREILALNEVSSKYGLVLSEEEARELSDTRNRALTENDRIEAGVGAVEKIIRTFCRSHYITDENYTYVLNEVTYLFYYIKTETDDKINDDELIDELFRRFELDCRGSVDTLEGREVERIIRKVNSGENYVEWYADRDELNYDSKTGLREAPDDYIRESYGDDYFDIEDDRADHDYYEDDDDYDYSGDEDFDIDVYDDFYDSENGYDPNENNEKTAREYSDDDDYDYLHDEDDGEY